MEITSIHNQKILSLRKLYKSNERKLSNLFIAEGIREVSQGLNSGFSLHSIYICNEVIGEIEKVEILKKITSNVEIYEISLQVYEKIVYRDNTEGVVAIFNKNKITLEDIKPENKNSTYIVLESVEKPGNLGAVLRTADAMGARGIILTESKIDQYNPNVIRASLGTIFKVPVVICNNIELYNWMKFNNIRTFSAALPAFHNLYELDFKGNTALIFGAESTGLTDFWIENSEKVFTIPMNGSVDSLNISVSVAISAYEVFRQQNFS